MRRCTRIAVCAAVVLCMTGAAGAAEKNFGVGLKLGYHNFIRYSDADDPDGDGVLDDGEIDRTIDSGAFDGFTMAADFQYRFIPNFVLGGGLQWYGAGVNVDATVDDNRVDGDINLSVTSLTVTPRFVLPVGIVHLYTGAGLGLYWRMINSTWEYTDALGNSHAESNSDSQGAVGLHALVGLEIFPVDWIGIVLEDNFAFAHFKGTDPKTDLDDSDAGGNSLLLGTRFHF